MIQKYEDLAEFQMSLKTADLMAQIIKSSTKKNENLINKILLDAYKSLKNLPSKKNCITALKILKLLRANHTQLMEMIHSNLIPKLDELSIEEKIEVAMVYQLLDFKQNHSAINTTGKVLPSTDKLNAFLASSENSSRKKIELCWTIFSYLNSTQECDIKIEDLKENIDALLSSDLSELSTTTQSFVLLMAKQVYEFSMFRSLATKKDNFDINYASISSKLYEKLQTKLPEKLSNSFEKIAISVDSPTEACSSSKIEVPFCYTRPDGSNRLLLYAHPVLLSYDRSTLSGVGLLQKSLFHYDEVIFPWMLG